MIWWFCQFREVHPTDLWANTTAVVNTNCCARSARKILIFETNNCKNGAFIGENSEFRERRVGKTTLWLAGVTNLFKLFLFPQPANPPTEWFSPDWLRRWGTAPPRPPFKHATALKWSGRSNWWDFCCPQHLKFSVRLVFIRIDVCVQLSLIFCGNVWVYFYRISIKGVL